MPKFISDRDINFFKGIAREVVDVVVENTIVLYKINLTDTVVNLYGESVNKTWHPGVELYALIDKQLQSTEYEGFGPQVNQEMTFKLDRFMCEEKNSYPEVGDVIYFNNGYFEIGAVTEVQFAGGFSKNNFSVVCNAFMVSRATLNIEERIN